MVVTGTFMQGWAFKSFDAGAIGRHFDYLLEAGIDTVILQTTASRLRPVWYAITRPPSPPKTRRIPMTRAAKRLSRTAWPTPNSAG